MNELLQEINTISQDFKIEEIKRKHILANEIKNIPENELDPIAFFYGKRHVFDFNEISKTKKRLNIMKKMIKLFNLNLHYPFLFEYSLNYYEFKRIYDIFQLIHELEVTGVCGRQKNTDYHQDRFIIKLKEYYCILLQNYSFNADSLMLSCASIKHAFQLIKYFFKRYVDDLPNEFIIYDIFNAKTRSNIHNKMDFYAKHLPLDTTDKWINYCNSHQRFSMVKIDPARLIPKDRLLLTQKTKRMKWSKFHKTHKYNKMWQIINQSHQNVIQGFLNDLIFYDSNLHRNIYFFEWIANIFDFELDDILKRCYTVRIDEDSNYISISSEIVMQTDLKEFELTHLNIFVNILLEDLNNVLGIQTAKLTDYVKIKKNTFKFKNFRSDGKISLVLDEECFDNNEGYIHYSKDNVKPIGCSIVNSSHENDSFLLQIINRSSDYHDALLFIFNKRLMIDNLTGMHEDINNDVDVEKNHQNINISVAAPGEMVDRHFAFENIYQGELFDHSMQLLTKAYFFYSIELHFFQKSVKIDVKQFQLLLDNFF